MNIYFLSSGERKNPACDCQKRSFADVPATVYDHTLDTDSAFNCLAAFMMSQQEAIGTVVQLLDLLEDASAK